MADGQTLAMVGGTALLGRDLVPVPDAVVVAAGRKIVAAGPAEDIPIPDEAKVIDARDGAILPGFIDAHVHIGLAEPAEVLRGGVTTVRDLAWPPDRIFPLARRAGGPYFDGPFIVAAGPMLTVEGGYPLTAGWAPPGTGLALHSADDARRAVAELAARGASIVKVALNPPAGNVVDARLLTTICGAAHDHELAVTAHVYGLQELHKALDAGVDELAHMLMSPEPLPDDTILRMVESHVRIVPTLSVFPPEELDVAVDNLSRFVGRGGTVIYGTDLGNEGPGPGIDELEVTRMAAAGMSARDIVRAATVDAASSLGLAEKGFLDRRMDADIICLDRRPTDASDLPRVVHVVREGRVAL